MPTKVWVVGEEVLAADFNPYVQEQIVATFANAAARDAAIPAPKSGMLVWLNDVHVWQGWNGSGWVQMAPGATICTSTSRPSSPFVGQQIYELDTGNTLYYQSAGTGWSPPWSTSWGLVARSSSTTDHSTVTAEQNVTGMTCTFTAVRNRIYRTTVTMPRNQQITTAAEAQAYICDGTNAHIDPVGWSQYLNPNETTTINAVTFETGLPAGGTTRKLRVSSTAANLRVLGAAYPGKIMVEDVGASAAPIP